MHTAPSEFLDAYRHVNQDIQSILYIHVSDVAHQIWFSVLQRWIRGNGLKTFIGSIADNENIIRSETTSSGSQIPITGVGGNDHVAEAVRQPFESNQNLIEESSLVVFRFV